MPNIALVTPTPIESEDLRRKIKPSPIEKQGMLSKGFLYDNPVIFSHCGIGKVNAAHSTTILLENEKIDLLIHFGIAGAYTTAEVGDIAVAKSENYGEEGVMTCEGWRSMEFLGFPLLKNRNDFFNTFRTDRKLCKLAVIASKNCGLNVFSGNFITVSQCSGTSVGGEIIRKRFNGLCENMEGAAVAHICAIYGIPMIEVRGISNMVEDRDIKKWNIPLAVSNCNKVVSELIRSLR